jgi:hypothetical protein
MSIPEDVATFLRKKKSAAYCDDCLQKAVPLKRRQQAQRVTDALNQTHDFTREKGRCVNCGGEKYVTKAN